MNKLHFWHYCLLGIFLYMAFYFGLASYPLNDNNEGLYAEIAREMLVTGHYIIPHLNYVPYIEKPPLLYWLVAGSYRILGATTFAARVVPATAALAICLGIFWFGKKMGQVFESWLATVILASSLGFIIIARMLFFDMLLTLCLTVTLILFYLWYLSEKNHYLRIAYIFLALGVLTKGLVCLALTFLITVSFLLLNKEWKKIRQLFDFWGITLFLLIVLPWHIAASMKQPGFLSYYFINEQLMRFLNKRIPHDYYTGPFYYYIPRLLIYIFPWCFLLPALTQRVSSENKSLKQLTLFLWLWFLIPLLFFSLSLAKANYYMVVGVPPLAYLLSLKLKMIFQKKTTGLFVFASAALFGLAILFAAYCKYFNIQINVITQQIYSLGHLWSVLFFLYGFFVLIMSIAIYRRNHFVLIKQSKNLLTDVMDTNNLACINRSLVLVLLIGGTTILLLIFSFFLLPRIGDEISEIKLANYLSTKKTETPLYLYHDYTALSSLSFYVQKRIAIIDSESSDLVYGAATPKAKDWFLSMQEFIRQIKGKAVYVALEKTELLEFNAATRGLNFCEVAASGHGTLLSNVPEDCNILQK